MNDNLLFVKHSRSGNLRRILAGAAALPLVASLVACAPEPVSSPSPSQPAGQTEEVTKIVVAHGVGVNGAAIAAIVVDFQAETGIRVDSLEFTDPEIGPKVLLGAETDRPSWDVILSTPVDVFLLANKDGYFAPIDRSSLDPVGLAGLEEANLIGDNYMVNQDVTALTVYSKTFDANPPSSWEDYFDLEKYPGARGLQSGGLGVTINLIIALLADGVAADDLYPLDLDRAFAKLDTIKGSVALWDAAPKAVQDVEAGNMAMTFVYSPAALLAIEKGQNVSVKAFDGAPVARGMATIMEDGPNGPAAGQAFLDYWSRPSVQAKYALLTSYGIVLASPAVYDLIDAENLKTAPFVPGQPQGKILNYEYFAEIGDGGVSNLETIIARWQEWRAS